MATHSSILAWRIPWTEEPGRLQSIESQEPDTNERLNNTFRFLETSLTSDSQARGGIVFWERLSFPRFETKGPRSRAWQPLPGDPSVEQVGERQAKAGLDPHPASSSRRGWQEVCGGVGAPPPLAAFSVSGFTLSSAFSTLILFGLGVIFPALHLFLCGTSKSGSLTGRGLTLCVSLCVCWGQRWVVG